MTRFMIGKKLGMTQIFNDNGMSIPVTAVLAGPVTVVQIKTVENDGYESVCVGFEDIPERKLNKPDKGIFDKTGVSTKRYLKEFRVDDIAKYSIGQELTVSDMFTTDVKVDVTGVTKGKGFAGTIKRYGTARGRETHGSHFHRRPGSMGACSSPGRVFKGKKLPGHMGVNKVTIQNLDVVKADKERNVLLIKGAVPGPKKGLLIIKTAVKSKA